MISIIITLIIVGLLIWLEETYLPIPAPFKKMIRVVAIILVVLWLLQVFGVMGLDYHFRR